MTEEKLRQCFHCAGWFELSGLTPIPISRTLQATYCFECREMYEREGKK